MKYNIHTFTRIFYFIFALVFTWLFANILLDNRIYVFNTFYVFICFTLWIAANCWIYKLIIRYEYVLIKHEKHLISLGFFGLLITQIYFGYSLAVQTAWDTEAVYKGAVALSTTGKLGNYNDYFHIFPHNLGATSILTMLFYAASLIGIKDYYLVGTLYNVCSINIGLLFVYLCIRKLKGIKAAYFSFWLGISCIPLYFYTPIFYTDTLSFPFIAICYYVYLQLINQPNFKKRLTYGGILGAFCALGAVIKFTAVIIGVAILIDIIFQRRFKINIFPLALGILIFAGIIHLFDSYRHNHILDKTLSDQKQVPYTHWMMMGLSGNGSYNGGDYEYTYTYNSQDERIEANLNRIQERLNNYGIRGYIEFINRKQQLNFGDGTFSVHEMIDDNPIRRNGLHQIGLSDGKYFKAFKDIAQGYHIALFALIILGCIYDVYSKPPTNNILLARIAIFGIYFFLALWEASSRYIINFLPIFFIAAAFRFPEIYQLLGSVKTSVADTFHQVNTQNEDRI